MRLIGITKRDMPLAGTVAGSCELTARGKVQLGERVETLTLVSF